MQVDKRNCPVGGKENGRFHLPPPVVISGASQTQMAEGLGVLTVALLWLAVRRRPPQRSWTFSQEDRFATPAAASQTRSSVRPAAEGEAQRPTKNYENRPHLVSCFMVILLGHRATPKVTLTTPEGSAKVQVKSTLLRIVGSH